jgi:hypothetical protein
VYRMRMPLKGVSTKPRFWPIPKRLKLQLFQNYCYFESKNPRTRSCLRGSDGKKIRKKQMVVMHDIEADTYDPM